MLIINFNNTPLIRSMTEGKLIEQVTGTLCPKQFEDLSIARNIMDSADLAESVMSNSILFTLLFSLVFKGPLKKLLEMINSLQLVFHLPIFQIVMPANVVELFNIMIPIV